MASCQFYIGMVAHNQVFIKKVYKKVSYGLNQKLKERLIKKNLDTFW